MKQFERQEKLYAFGLGIASEDFILYVWWYGLKVLFVNTKSVLQGF